MNTIQTNSNYIVVKKLLSIHSEDRDIVKWPDPTHFEITAPVEYKNVVSLRLNDVELPTSFYNFNESNQNTKLSFKVIPNYVATIPNFPNWATDASSQLIALQLYNSSLFTITIPSGSYNYEQLANELTAQLNDTISNFIGIPYTNFQVKYNTISMKMIFLNTNDNFEFNFTNPELYDTTHINCYDNYTNWGLGNNLGFKKRQYTGTLVPKLSMTWDNSTALTNVYWLEPPHTVDLFGDSHVYMELMYYNSMDEILPYAEKSNASNNAKFGGKHNSAFAKLPLFARHIELSNKDTYLSNIFLSDPPLERIQKFKIKLRYHDGRPIDFNNNNFDFTIEIIMLKPDSLKPSIKVNANYSV